MKTSEVAQTITNPLLNLRSSAIVEHEQTMVGTETIHLTTREPFTEGGQIDTFKITVTRQR
jgi:hypothetical protein